ncbi:hypothetical protein M409DRAFT_18707 [Zasmidium cellare ATCC 36951]|uniref:Chromo domain-containing protein n=1 Tax=Zasmidium cellare ATCC 36951 TaxID=1080233 RepID=A0A6A6CUL1_ZASCE|nr:uncharacterized protein M409DRAFT_18707 [Zasmidium cellare ATCC 36951]KAF2170735.1 hypothetical protein M409DRAFT_18707 [Zasmidium cellare ATCC 36951]
MAKRKRSSSTLLGTPESGRDKRRREEVKTTPHPHGNVDPERLYKVRAILQETEDQYEIDWADDEVTGESYEPTWEPKKNANRLAVEEWEARKEALKQIEEPPAATAAATPAPVKRGRGRPRKYPVQPVESAAKRPRGRPPKNRPVPETSLSDTEAATPSFAKPPPARNRKVIESSSPEQGQQSDFSPRPEPAPSSSANDPGTELEIEESDTEGALTVDDGDNPSQLSLTRFEGEQVQVQLGNPPSSFDAGAYEKLSPQTSPVSNTQRSPNVVPGVESQDPVPPTQSQVTSTETGNGTSLVIPDSQSQLLYEESSSFKGFSTVSGSRRHSTAQSEAVSAVRQSPIAASKTQIASSAFKKSTLNSAAASQVFPGADTTTGRAELEGAANTTPEHTDCNQDNSTSQQRSSLVEGRIGFGPTHQEQEQASSGALQDDDTVEADSQLRRELRNSSAHGRPEGAVTSGHQPLYPQKPASNSGSVPEASQHESLQHNTQGRSPRHSKHPTQLDQSRISTPANTQTNQSVVDGEDAQRPIIVSSNEDQEQSPYSSLGPSFTLQSRSSHYRPPPAGQKPPPSSATHPRSSLANESPANAANSTSVSHSLPSAPRESESQSQEQPSERRQDPSTQYSSPFQTQIRPPLESLSTNRVGRSKADTTASAQKSHSQPSPRQTLDYSQFPLVPSQSLGFLGESAPPQLDTPEDMAKTPSPKETLLQIQNNGQPASSLPPLISAEVTAAQRTARLSLPPEGGRSPSMIPAMEPSPEVTKEEMNTSERYETLLPQAQGSNSGNETHNTNGESTSRPLQEPEADPEIANVHDVPVGLFGIQRDSYLQNLWLHDDMIKKFLQERDPSESLLKQADGLFDRLRCIVMHPDLVNPEALSQLSTPERQAQWDCDSSAKFRFLREFINNQSDRSFHIAIVVRGQKVADMLEMLLKGSHVSFKKSYPPTNEELPEQESSEHEEPSVKSAVRATIVDLDQEALDIEPADIVIAMDGLVQYQHPTVRAYRQHKRHESMSWANDWAGLYILVAPRTIEHIERSLLPGLTGKARTRTLLTAINQFHDHFSKKGDGKGQLPSLKQAAQDVVDYLEDPEAEWPLEPLSVIENLDSQTDTDGVSGLDQQSSSAQESNSVKRPLDSADDATSSGDVSKRPRLESDADVMPATINPQDVEITHVSDSLGHGTQSNLLPVSELYASGEASTAEQHLHQVFEEQQNRLEGHVKALEDLQYRHEDQRVELVQVQRERDGAIATASAAVERMRVTETNSSALRAERTELKEKLEEANRKLLDHTVPERAEFEALRAEMEQAKADRDKAEKRAQAAQKELEYSREMYQDCSSRARDLALEKAELEKELVVASARAEGEAARARQASQDMRYKLFERENAKLKAVLQDREAGLKFRDEEITRLKEATRGRMGTRQSSVPRSPRVGSPIKGRVGAGSRQASPAAGDVRVGRGGHPLRRSD